MPIRRRNAIDGRVLRADMVGKRYGFLTVIRYAESYKNGAIRWLCLCDCGKEKIIQGQSLRNGTTFSCGCMRKELHSRRIITHGESTGGKTTKEYRTWYGIILRCHNPSDKGYERYGKRGITVCDEWRNSYTAFLQFMGRAPTKKHSIDRINVYGNYEPGNVCWATAKWQAQNRRSSVKSDANAFSGVLSFGA